MAGSPLSSMSLGRGSAWAVAGGAACACVAVAVANPEERQLTPSCPFRVATGWWCPFCGATRSVSRLVRADVASAARYNLLLVVGVTIMLAALLVRTSSLGERAAAVVRGNVAAMWWSALVVTVVFTVVRNVPGADAYLRYPGA